MKGIQYDIEVEINQDGYIVTVPALPGCIARCCQGDQVETVAREAIVRYQDAAMRLYQTRPVISRAEISVKLPGKETLAKAGFTEETFRQFKWLN